MKQLLFIALIGFAAVKGWNSYKSSSVEPLYAQPYIAVYGRDSCSITQRTLRDLRQKNIAYEYHSVDKQAVADSLHIRMERAGISTRRYNLPVVDVSGQIDVRPTTETIVSRFKG